VCSIPGSSLMITAMRWRSGLSSRSSCKRVPTTALEPKERPVALPPGLPRLPTVPMAKGSPTATKTIGMVLVARTAATVAGVPPVTRRSTPDATTARTIEGNCSASSIQRSTIATLAPSLQPSARRPSRNALRRSLPAWRGPAMTRPIRATWAIATDGALITAATAETSMNWRRLMTSLDDLIGALQERVRDSEAERLCCLQVDDQSEFRRRLDRQVGWFFATQDAVDIRG